MGRRVRRVCGPRSSRRKRFEILLKGAFLATSYDHLRPSSYRIASRPLTISFLFLAFIRAHDDFNEAFRHLFVYFYNLTTKRYEFSLADLQNRLKC